VADGNVPAPGGRRVRSALFVDFENIFLGLQRLDGAEALRFATNPPGWLGWLEKLTYPALGLTGPFRRDVLIRYCYLNPVSSGRYRAYFTRAGFHVVDCPPLTAAGKNSADIHVVIDILDLLAHPTRFDEVVLLSADADYTPVMLRLRAHDRRTVIITSGPSAPAFRAACDHVVPEDIFIDLALSTQRGEVDLARADGTPPAVREPVDHLELRRRIADQVTKLVAAAKAPVSLASAAQLVRDHLGQAADGWAGTGSFKKLLLAAAAADDLPGLAISSSGPGYIYDPDRHDPPPEHPGGEKAADPGDPCAELAARISRVTDIPGLTSDGYRILFEELAAEVGENGFSRHGTSRAVRDRCVERGEQVGRNAVNFVLNGLLYAGQSPRRGDTAEELAAIFADNAVALCQNARMELSPDEITLLRQWVAPSATPAG
jgi:hypothetical protein